MDEMSVDLMEILKRFFKYVCEGLMVAIAAFVFPRKKMNPDEILMIAAVASATFAISICMLLLELLLDRVLDLVLGLLLLISQEVE